MWLVKTPLRIVLTALVTIVCLDGTFVFQIYIAAFSSSWEGEPMPPLWEVLATRHTILSVLIGLAIACLAIVVVRRPTWVLRIIGTTFPILAVLMGLLIACLVIVVFAPSPWVPGGVLLIAVKMMLPLLIMSHLLFPGAVTCIGFLALFYFLKFGISRRRADEEHGDEQLPEKHEVG